MEESSKPQETAYYYELYDSNQKSIGWVYLNDGPYVVTINEIAQKLFNLLDILSKNKP